MSTLDVQRVTGVIELDTPFLVTLNSAFNTANSGYNKANTANVVATSAFNKANSALANASGTLAGDLTITGNVVVSSNTISINGQNVSTVQSFRNKIINGNFDFWQRETSNTSVNNNQYVSDRWVHGRAGTTANVSRQSFTLGQTDVPGEPTYFNRTVVTSVAGASNLYLSVQRIESVRTLAGQTATLSFWAKADASKNMAVEFGQNFGTGGSPSATVTGIEVTTCALTTSWKKFTITVNIPSISGKTLGSNNNDFFIVGFWFDAGSDFNSRTNSLGQQSGTFDIAQVQLEAGPVATPFEVRPIGTELALCQRYYNDNLYLRVGGGSTPEQLNRQFYATTIFPVAMRASPTVTKKTETLENMNAGSFSDTTAYYTRYTATNSVTNDASSTVTFFTSAEL